MRFWIVTLGLLTQAFQIHGQQVQVAEILASALQDQHITQHREIVAASSLLPLKDGLFRNVEGRIGINGSALGDTIYGYIRNEDSYGLIVSTNSFRERKQQAKVIQAEQTSLQAIGAVYLTEALALRYEAIIDFYFAQKEFSQHTAWQALLTERQRILRTMAEGGIAVKAKDIIECERDKLRAAQLQHDLEQKMQMRNLQLAQFLGKSAQISLDTAGFISLRQMRATVIDSEHNFASTHPDLALLQSKLLLEKAKIAYAESQNKQVLQSVRLGYDRPLYLTRPNRFNTQNNLSVRLGLALPLPGNNRFRKSLATIDQMKAQLDLTDKSTAISEDLRTIKANMLAWTRILDRTQAEAQQSLIPVYLQDPILRASLTPLDINELHLIQHQAHASALSTEYEIAKCYLDFLSTTGLLGAQPEKNWLADK
jgi:hypothetical protein